MQKMLTKIGLILTVMVVLAASLVAVSGAAAATSDCIAFAVDLRNDAPIPLTAVIFFGDLVTGEPLTDVVSLTLQPGESGTLRLVATVTEDAFFLGGGPGGLTIIGVDSFGDGISFDNCTGGGFSDGRLNNGGDQLAAPVAVYSSDDGIEVWTINPESGDGRLLFVATNEEIDAAGSDPAENTLIEQAENVALYRLTGGAFQLNAFKLDGTLYEFRFTR